MPCRRRVPATKLLRVVALALVVVAVAQASGRADDQKEEELRKENEQLRKKNEELEKRLKEGSTAPSGTAPATSTTPGAAETAPTTSMTPGSKTVSSEIFPVRLFRTLLEDLSSDAYSPPEPNAPPPRRRRKEPAPFDSPPYPVGEWQMNGTITIGDANVGTPYPSVIMDTLYNGPNGDWWKENRFALYGWLDVGGNISNERDSNAPTGYIIRPNKVEIDQVTAYLERRPDANQTESIDWGFRVTALYGLDERFTISKGIWDEQLHKYHPQASSQLPTGQLWGFDIPMCYVDLYIPWVADGMNIRIGRFISIPDIEAQLAPDNLMYTHSLLYTYDIYTQMGGVATIKLDDMWAFQLGLVSGNDVALWEHRRFKAPNSGPTNQFRVVNNGIQPSAIAMVQWIGPQWALGRDSVYVGVNGINDGRYGYNNIQELPIGTWTHKFNEYVAMYTEAWYMYERNNPILGAYTWETAAVNYLIFRVGPNTLFTIRNEYFQDAKGARTGVKTQYSEHTFGFTHWFNKLLTFRPEFGYWHSYNERAFDNGRKADQFLVAADMIIHY